ncbi:hypothetical protein [Xanthomonas albilineans]|uniref:hypothetical protein n=1 Tax=Xanthomonas albilineans TaxID=29447 RepID=UPI001E2FB144|nr:hypothetical protein [Xanthomonas albilineans]
MTSVRVDKGGTMEESEEAPAITAGKRPEYLHVTKREGSGIWLTLIVGACLAAALAGGAKIYLDTVADWQSARDDKAARTTAQRNAGNAALSAQQIEDRERLIAKIRAERTKLDQANSAENARAIKWMSDGEVRCINGMVFRRINGGWENFPGSSCNYH